MDNTFVLGGSKKTIFSRPREVGLTQNPGGRLAEIFTANHFHFLIIF